MVFLILLFPNNVFAEDSLSISSWIVSTVLDENGDLQVWEDLTFNFNDEFNGVFRDIVLDGTDGIKDLQLFEVANGTEIPYTNDQDADKGDSNVYSFKDNKTLINIMIFSPSNNEEKTFRLKYTLLNVAVMHSDTGEFYYKYIGEGNKTPINYFSASLILPKPDMENVKIFAHGPLNGNINFVDNTAIRLEVSDVPTDTFVEARVLYPKDFTPLSSKTGDDDLKTILDEEHSLIKEIEEKATSRKKVKGFIDKISIGILGVGALVAAWFYKVNRRDPSIYKHNNSIYPKDISPAELSLFLDQAISSRGLLASIFDLARREYLIIDEMQKDSSIYNKKELKRQDFEFTRTNKADGNLLEHERFLLDWLFDKIGNSKNVSTIDIDKARNKATINFSKSQNEWYRLVREQLKTRGYSDQSSKKPGIIMLLLSIPVFILGIIGIIFESLIGITALLVGIMMFILGIITLTRKSDEGYLQYELWKDFKKEFENYKDLDIGIPKDKTLIYAVALGLSLKKLEDQRRYYGNDYYPSYWGIWYFSSLNKKGGSAFEDRFNNSFYGSTDASSPHTTSFGGGGGFSGGGGGGAGGGGAGGF